MVNEHKIGKTIELQILNDFVTLDDQEKFINMMNSLDKNNKLDQTRDGRKISINPSELEIKYFIKKYSNRIKEIFPHLYIHQVLVGKYETGSYMDVHRDSDSYDECQDCEVTAVVYFNNDYTGGEIYFPKINEQYLPDAGSAVMFGIHDIDYDHGVKPIESGIKYAMPMCFTNNKKYLNMEYDWDSVLNKFKMTN